VYDEETECYYLVSRYYNTYCCRFLNIDNAFELAHPVIKHNLFAYCTNNPVIYYDLSGSSIILACIFIFAGIGMIVGGCCAAQSSMDNLGYVDGWWVAAGIIGGGALGAACGYGVGTLITSLSAMTIISGEKIAQSWQQAE